MTGWLRADADKWGGHPVARRVADAEPRGRVRLTGIVRSAEVARIGGAPALRCVLDDVTGEIALLFIGRERVPGMVPGAVCTVEGTARPEQAQRGVSTGRILVIWNPLYRFEAAHGG